jgi:hypothetical protein
VFPPPTRSQHDHSEGRARVLVEPGPYRRARVYEIPVTFRDQAGNRHERWQTVGTFKREALRRPWPRLGRRRPPLHWLCRASAAIGRAEGCQTDFNSRALRTDSPSISYRSRGGHRLWLSGEERRGDASPP